jgi:hypothetical protein
LAYFICCFLGVFDCDLNQNPAALAAGKFWFIDSVFTYPGRAKTGRGAADPG